MSKKEEDEINYTIDDIPNFSTKKKLKHEDQKIINIIVKASKEARRKKLDIINIKGTFTIAEKKKMIDLMLKKNYNTWKTENGYVFVPSVIITMKPPSGIFKDCYTNYNI